MRTFVIADTHWGHGNIIGWCGRPPNHDHLMLQRWAETVGPDDLVYHLGDVIWNRAGHLWPAIKRLPGRRTLVPGNHDTQTKTFYRDKLGFNFVAGTGTAWRWDASFLPLVVDDVRLCLSHVPLPSCAAWDLNIHGHIHDRETTNPATHRNVCVELTDYRPVDLHRLVSDWKHTWRTS